MLLPRPRPMRRTVLGAAVALLLAWPSLEPADGFAEAPSPGAQDPAQEPRLEHFLLELPTRDGLRPIGTLVWIAKGAGQELELEWDLVFAGEGLRLLALERLGPAGASLVWRELTDRARSLVVEWAPAGGELVLREWARDGTLRETRSSAAGAVLPLYLLELARAGDLVQGRFQVFDPTARALVGVELKTSYRSTGGAQADPGATPGPHGGLERQVELWREDGTLAGRYRFQAGHLIGFEWQEGGIRGRRVERAELEAAGPPPRRPISFPPATDEDRAGSREPLPDRDGAKRSASPQGSVRER